MIIRKSGINQRNHGIGSDFSIITESNMTRCDRYLGDSKTGGGLPSADSAETRLVLDNAVWDSHLSAQSWQEHNQLNKD